MPEREDYVQRIVGRSKLIEPQIIPDVVLDALCWTGPASRAWQWTVPDDGFIWHILAFTGAFYPTALIYGDFKVNGTYWYRYSGIYSWYLEYERLRAPVVEPNDVIQVNAINFSSTEKCLTWSMMFHREPE
jgi:hypothetical protein